MTTPRRVSWARYSYLILAGLFTASVLLQTYIAGMAVFVDSANWTLHTTFVHVFEPLLLVLFVVGFVGELPRLLKAVPVGLFVLLMVQYATASMAGSLVAAIHPVNAVVIILLALLAVKQTWTVIRE